MRPIRVIVGAFALAFMIMSCDAVVDPPGGDPLALKGTLIIPDDEELTIGNTVSFYYRDDTEYQSYRWFYKESSEGDDKYREAAWDTDNAICIVFLKSGSYDMKVQIPEAEGEMAVSVVIGPDVEDPPKESRFVFKKTPSGDYAASLFLDNFDDIFSADVRFSRVNFCFLTRTDPATHAGLYNYSCYNYRGTETYTINGVERTVDHDYEYVDVEGFASILRNLKPWEIAAIPDKSLSDEAMLVSAEDIPNITRAEVMCQYVDEFGNFFVGSTVFLGGFALTDPDLEEFYILAR